MAKRKKPVLVIEIATVEQLEHCAEEVKALAARMASHKPKSNYPPRKESPMNGIESIAAERMRQIESEEWAAAHDDNHSEMELSKAAACYALFAVIPATPRARRHKLTEAMRHLWPFHSAWWKPTDGTRRCLVKAGALIAAEIDRIDRAASKSN